MGWQENIRTLGHCLENLRVKTAGGQALLVDRAFDQWKKLTEKIREDHRTIYLVGNGASASMACHMAADLDKNAGVRTQVFTDPALITAIANDLDYRQVFSEPLRRRMSQGDMLVAISSSGASPNVLEACKTTRSRGGVIVTLSAMKPDNPLQNQGDLNFYVPGKTYGQAETSHAAILHHWMDRMLE